jgi:hypothetical protein
VNSLPAWHEVLMLGDMAGAGLRQHCGRSQRDRFFNTILFDEGTYLVSASAPAATSATEPVTATAGTTTASVIDSAFAALAFDTTATPPKRKNPFASFR